MEDYEREAEAARLDGEIRALEIRRRGLTGQTRSRSRARLAEITGGQIPETPLTRRYEPRTSHYTRADEVTINGRKQCPGGCDIFVGGCILHADNC